MPLNSIFMELLVILTDSSVTLARSESNCLQAFPWSMRLHWHLTIRPIYNSRDYDLRYSLFLSLQTGQGKVGQTGKGTLKPKDEWTLKAET